MKSLAFVLGMPLLSVSLWGQGAVPATAAVADPVVITVGSEKITQSMFEQIIATLPAQQQSQLQTPEARRSLAEQIAELTSSNKLKHTKLHSSGIYASASLCPIGNSSAYLGEWQSLDEAIEARISCRNMTCPSSLISAVSQLTLCSWRQYGESAKTPPSHLP